MHQNRGLVPFETRKVISSGTVGAAAAFVGCAARYRPSLARCKVASRSDTNSPSRVKGTDLEVPSRALPAPARARMGVVLWEEGRAGATFTQW
jgi:hypothetical protein